MCCKGRILSELARHLPEDLNSDSSEVVEDSVWIRRSPDPTEPYTPAGGDNQPEDSHSSWLTAFSAAPSEPGLGARTVPNGNATLEKPVNEPRFSARAVDEA